MAHHKSLTIDNINPRVKAAKYAVRGELAVRAEKYRSDLGRGQAHLPFDSVISANIGNPQQLDQKPLTFFRQVASLIENPVLLDKPDILEQHLGYPADVLQRARAILGDVHSVGAYSQSMGSPLVRKSVADFIRERDGFDASPDDVYLTAGASSGVNTLMTVICATPQTGILIPIPQYPLYTATLSLLDAQPVPYYLEEPKNWSTNLDSIKDALEKARSEGVDVRAIVVINPGNPTGSNLDASNISQILQFAAQERLAVLADEVYQTNVFEGEFTSFKKGLRLLQKERPGEYDHLELASLHSISKGMIGECGHRGGYMELVGFDPEVVEQIYKFVSIQLCPPVVGQALVECMVNPPRQGDPSYDVYRSEYDHIFQGLKERAYALYDAFKKMEGVDCQRPTGSMYLYPSIDLPKGAQQAAEQEGKNVDDYYVSRLLDATGICMVPGSGFGQREGTFHFRTTFLPPGTEWVGRIREFHEKFMGEFR